MISNRFYMKSKLNQEDWEDIYRSIVIREMKITIIFILISQIIYWSLIIIIVEDLDIFSFSFFFVISILLASSLIVTNYLSIQSYKSSFPNRYVRRYSKDHILLQKDLEKNMNEQNIQFIKINKMDSDDFTLNDDFFNYLIGRDDIIVIYIVESNDYYIGISYSEDAPGNTMITLGPVDKKETQQIIERILNIPNPLT